MSARVILACVFVLGQCRREAIGDAAVGQAWDVKQLVDKMFAAIK
jgi:hypothetical protein